MFKWFTNEEITASLEGIRRQYFAGDLDDPQVLEALSTKDLEIGLTSYDEHTSEPPHFHTEATEYQYVISGWTQYLDVETKELHEFKAGDFFAIYPGTVYAQKSKPGTKILFIKVPSTRDKIVAKIDGWLQEWLDERLETTRSDYYHDPSSPKANSIRPATAVAIVSNDKLLMVKRKDSGNWTLPGGTLDFGESMPYCAMREIREETALDVELLDIVGTYTDPGIKIAYSDGEVRQEFTVVYFGRAKSTNVIVDDESSAYAWIPIDELSGVQVATSQRKRLDDVVSYLTTGKKHMG